ncbi:MAG TPA: peptidoglycan recognition family protein [Polyangiaceae bacterium]
MEARNYTKARGSNGTVTRIVIHDMEIPEKPDTAEACARMFATTTGQKSVHFCVDSNSIVQGVPLDCRAWHAPPNMGSVGIEHAGFVKQTREQWLDDYGRAMLDISARLTAFLCKMFKLPVVRLTPQQLRDGQRGICGHNDVAAAWRQTDHTDPGSNFPWDYYLGLVRKYYEGGVMATLDKDDVDAVAQATFAKIFNYVIPGQALNYQTLVKRTAEGVARIETAMDPHALAEAIASEMGPGSGISTEALAEALAAVLAKRLES